jgi:hypothetical protein
MKTKNLRHRDQAQTFGSPLETGNPAIGAVNMHGTLLVFQPHAVPQVTEFSRPPDC